jgi:hypothetical protein
VSEIIGVICGYRVEQILHKLMRQIRYLDRLVDELAKGKAMPRSWESPQGAWQPKKPPQALEPGGGEMTCGHPNAMERAAYFECSRPFFQSSPTDSFPYVPVI